MCGCAVELNMNSFIRARQKDTPNTDEAQARTHIWSLFHPQPPFYLVKDTFRLFFWENIFPSQGEMCVHQLLLSPF